MWAWIKLNCTSSIISTKKTNKTWFYCSFMHRLFFSLFKSLISIVVGIKWHFPGLFFNTFTCWDINQHFKIIYLFSFFRCRMRNLDLHLYGSTASCRVADLCTAENRSIDTHRNVKTNESTFRPIFFCRKKKVTKILFYGTTNSFQFISFIIIFEKKKTNLGARKNMIRNWTKRRKSKSWQMFEHVTWYIFDFNSFKWVFIFHCSQYKLHEKETYICYYNIFLYFFQINFCMFFGTSVYQFSLIHMLRFIYI